MSAKIAIFNYACNLPVVEILVHPGVAVESPESRPSIRFTCPATCQSLILCGVVEVDPLADLFAKWKVSPCLLGDNRHHDNSVVFSRCDSKQKPGLVWSADQT